MYESIIQRHIVPVLGKIKLKALKTRDIQRFLNNKFTNGRVKDQTYLSPRTVKHIHQILNTSLRQAVKEWVIPFNPAEHCDLPRQERKEMRVLNPEELTLFLRTAQEKSPHFCAFYLKISTGMRRYELLVLTWDCINFKEHTVEIKLQVVNGEDNAPEIKDLKTRHSRRTVKVDYETISLLKFHKKQQWKHKKTVGIYHESDNPEGLYHDNNLVFATDEGKPINPDLYKAL